MEVAPTAAKTAMIMKNVLRPARWLIAPAAQYAPVIARLITTSAIVALVLERPTSEDRRPGKIANTGLMMNHRPDISTKTCRKSLRFSPWKSFLSGELVSPLASASLLTPSQISDSET